MIKATRSGRHPDAEPNTRGVCNRCAGEPRDALDALSYSHCLSRAPEHPPGNVPFRARVTHDTGDSRRGCAGRMMRDRAQVSAAPRHPDHTRGWPGSRVAAPLNLSRKGRRPWRKIPGPARSSSAEINIAHRQCPSRSRHGKSNLSGIARLYTRCSTIRRRKQNRARARRNSISFHARTTFVSS